MAGVFLGTYLGTYLGSRVVGTPGSGSFSPLDLSPVAWWDGTDASTMNTADDGSGSVPSVGNDVQRWVDKANGHILKTPAASVPSLAADGLLFDGTGEYMEDGETGNLARFKAFHGAGPASVWMRYKISGTTVQAILDTRGATTTDPSWALFCNTTRRPLWARRTSAGENSVTFTEAPANDTVVDQIITINGNTVRCYLDGAEVASSPLTLTGTAGTADTPNPLRVGTKHVGGSVAFDGTIQHLVFVESDISDRLADISGFAP